MKPCIVQKVPFRLPGSSCLVFAMILAERESLALLFVPKTGDDQTHKLFVATQNVPERPYESVGVSYLPLEQEDLVGIGTKLNALGDGLAEDEIEQFFKSEGLW